MLKRKMTLEHQWLEIMCQRRGLDASKMKRLENLDRGFSGECLFDQFVGELGGRGWKVYSRRNYRIYNEYFMLNVVLAVSEKINCRNQLKKYLHEIERAHAFGRVNAEKFWIQ